MQPTRSGKQEINKILCLQRHFYLFSCLQRHYLSRGTFQDLNVIWGKSPLFTLFSCWEVIFLSLGPLLTQGEKYDSQKKCIFFILLPLFHIQVRFDPIPLLNQCFHSTFICWIVLICNSCSSFFTSKTPNVTVFLIQFAYRHHSYNLPFYIVWNLGRIRHVPDCLSLAKCENSF